MLFVAIMPAAAIAIALSLYFLALRYADAESALANRGSALTRQFAPAAEYGAFSGNRDELHRLAHALAREPDVTAVVVNDRAGAVLALSGTPRLLTNPALLPDGWSGHAEDGETLFFHAKIARPVLPLDDTVILSADKSQAVAPLGSVTLEMSRASLTARKLEMIGVALIVALAVLAMGALLAWRLARDVTEPIVALQDAVKRIRGGRLETRVEPHPGRTLHGLEEGVNEMAASMQTGRDRLQHRIEEATAELKQKKEEAERASIAKSRFLAAASHDLRQPLHALALFAADLEHQAGSDPQRKLAGQITTAVGSLSELFDALLDISRLDIGALAPSRLPFALDPLLQRVVAAHSHSARAKGLTLRYMPTQAWTLSDPRLLERMVGSLVSNAIRYTWRGGIVVGVRREDDNLRIEVWDSGIGIAEDHQQLIFQEFFQVANPERDPGKGLGLGLSLVDRLAGMLAHPLHLRSQPGRGSVFGITLPRAAPLVATTIGEGQALGGFDARVLVLSISTAACDSLCRLLASWGCEVTCTPTGAEAALRLGAPPDLIICEDDLCGEALPFIEAMAAAGESPPLIMIGDIPSRLEAKAGNRNTIRLAKPMQPAKLRALMRHLLGETRAAHPPSKITA